MISGPALPCPKCQRVLNPLAWHDESHGRCRSCDVEFAFTGFPALTAPRVHAAPKAAVVDEHATCFFHTENQAETVCESCGRLLCTVCAIEFSGRRLCPGCMAASRKDAPHASDHRTLFDGLALALAFFPLLIYPLTLFTAPIALGCVIYGWRKPRSLVAPGRARLIVAGVAALLEIVAWVVVFILVFTRK
jgi:hypothetical protein